jgi:hypothetical protein
LLKDVVSGKGRGRPIPPPASSGSRARGAQSPARRGGRPAARS